MKRMRSDAASRKHLDLSRLAATGLAVLLLSPIATFADSTERSVEDIKRSLKKEVTGPKERGVTCENVNGPSADTTADAQVFNHHVICKKTERLQGGKNGKQQTVIFDASVARSVKNDGTEATEVFTESRFTPGDTPETPVLTQMAYTSVIAYENAPVDSTKKQTGTIINNSMITPSYREVFRKNQPHWHGEVFGSKNLKVTSAQGSFDKEEAVVIGWRDEPIDENPAGNRDFLNDKLQENFLPDVADSGITGLDAGFVSSSTNKEETYNAYFNRLKKDRVIFDDTYILDFSKTERLNPLAGFAVEGSILSKQTYQGAAQPKEQTEKKITAEKETLKTGITRKDQSPRFGPLPESKFEISNCDEVTRLNQDIRTDILTPIMNGLDSGLVYFKETLPGLWQKDPSLPTCVPK